MNKTKTYKFHTCNLENKCKYKQDMRQFRKFCQRCSEHVCFSCQRITQRAVQTFLERQLDPRGVLPKFPGKPIATCYFPGAGVLIPCPPPSSVLTNLRLLVLGGGPVDVVSLLIDALMFVEVLCLVVVLFSELCVLLVLQSS